DAVQLGVGGAERGPAQVAIDAEPFGGAVGFGQQLVGGAAFVVLGGDDRAAQQQRAVHRQRLGRVGADVVVELGGVGAGGGDGGGQMVAARQGVGDDAGACPDGDGVVAGAGGAHAAVGGEVGQALVVELEQQPRGDV